METNLAAHGAIFFANCIFAVGNVVSSISLPKVMPTTSHVHHPNRSQPNLRRPHAEKLYCPLLLQGMNPILFALVREAVAGPLLCGGEIDPRERHHCQKLGLVRAYS